MWFELDQGDVGDHKIAAPRQPNRANTALSPRLASLRVKVQLEHVRESQMAWRTQREIIRDRDQDRRDRERREARDASAYWDGGGCEAEDADDGPPLLDSVTDL
jgi:hypothetical protein